MSKIHSMRTPLDDDFHRISISIKSKLLCDILIKYKKELTKDLEITIKSDCFTFKDDQYLSYFPTFPYQIVAGLIELIGVWQDLGFISYDIGEQLVSELSTNSVLINISIDEMEWNDTNYKFDGECEKTFYRTFAIHDGRITRDEPDEHWTISYDSKDLTGDSKTVYELVAKNYYFVPELGSVLYKKYASTLKLTEEEFIAILDSLTESGYLRTEVGNDKKLSYYPANIEDTNITMTITKKWD